LSPHLYLPCLLLYFSCRYLSARKEERVEASNKLFGPSEIPQVDGGQLLDDAKQALYMAKVGYFYSL
jgi:6-phosphogluconate dehydrogenase